MVLKRKMKCLTAAALIIGLAMPCPVYAEEEPETEEIPEETIGETEEVPAEVPEESAEEETVPESTETEETEPETMETAEPADVPETAEEPAEETPEEAEQEEITEETVPEESDEKEDEEQPQDIPAETGEEELPETSEEVIEEPVQEKAEIQFSAGSGKLINKKGKAVSKLTVKVLPGETVELPVPDAEAYFLGWSLTEENGEIIEELTAGEENITLYAVYAEVFTAEIELVEGELFVPESRYDGIAYVSDQEEVLTVGEDGWTAGIPGTASVKGTIDGHPVEEYTVTVIEAGVNEASRMRTAKKSEKESTEKLDQIKAFVTRMYQLCLDREPDKAGLKDWCNQLRNGTATGASIARGFFYSREYQSKNLNNVEYVTTAYRVFLNREPDSGGLNNWVDVLDAGCTYDYILRGFIESKEFTEVCEEYGISRGGHPVTSYRDRNIDITRFVSRLYINCLGRRFDEGGLEYWTQLLYTQERSAADVARGFFNSRELTSMRLSNKEFVKRAYIAILDRNAEPAGLNNWVNALKHGMTRQAVINGFLNSKEFRGMKTLKNKKSGVYEIPDESGNMIQVYYDWNGNIARQSFLADQVYYQIDPLNGEIIHMQKQMNDKIYMEGIDISTHNGDIDLSEYEDGFVIIRVGYGTNADKRAVRNMNLCEKLRIPYGVYLYSYALDEEAAQAEAKFVLKMIKGRDIKCGVWYDMEDADFYKQRHGVTESEQISAMCQIFCRTVEKAGYHVGIYASYSWFNEGLITGCDEYDRWVANWGNNDGNLHRDYSGYAAIHQYTSNPIDRDIILVDPVQLMK